MIRIGVFVALSGVLESALLEGSFLSDLSQVVVLLSIWMAIGMVSAVILWARGHELGPNLALGAVLGPLFIALARNSIRSQDELDLLVVAEGQTQRPGLEAVVIVLSDPGLAADAGPILHSMIRLGRVTVAMPITVEEALRIRGRPADSEQAKELAAAGLMLSEWNPRLVLLPGTVSIWADSLTNGANDCLLLMVGERPGMSTRRIASASKRPVVSIP